MFPFTGPFSSLFKLPRRPSSSVPDLPVYSGLQDPIGQSYDLDLPLMPQRSRYELPDLPVSRGIPTGPFGQPFDLPRSPFDVPDLPVREGLREPIGQSFDLPTPPRTTTEAKPTKLAPIDRREHQTQIKAFNAQAAEHDAARKRLDAMKAAVDPTNQESIDTFNAEVNAFNSQGSTLSGIKTYLTEQAKQVKAQPAEAKKAPQKKTPPVSRPAMPLPVAPASMPLGVGPAATMETLGYKGTPAQPTIPPGATGPTRYARHARGDVYLPPETPNRADVHLPYEGSEKQFQAWYADKAKKYKLAPDPDDPKHFYDYRAAFAAGAEPDKTGHWPSQFKLSGHPSEVVGGFNARNGERVPGTKRASEAELVKLGWTAKDAKILAAMPEPGQGPSAEQQEAAKQIIAGFDKQPWSTSKMPAIVKPGLLAAPPKKVEGPDYRRSVIAAAEAPEASPIDRVVDLANGLGRGVIGLADGAVALADLANKYNPYALGFDPKEKINVKNLLKKQLGYDGKQWKQWLEEHQSPERLAEQRDFDQAKGFVDTTIATLTSGVGPTMAAESLPGMFAAGRIAKMLPVSTMLASAIGEGGVAGVQNVAQHYEETGELPSAKQLALYTASGAITGAVNRVFGGLANKYNYADIDTMFARAASQPALRKKLETATAQLAKIPIAYLSEAAEEAGQTAPETIISNIVSGRPWSEGVVKETAAGAAVGGLMGTAGQVVETAHDRFLSPPETEGLGLVFSGGTAVPASYVTALRGLGIPDAAISQLTPEQAADLIAGDMPVVHGDVDEEGAPPPAPPGVPPGPPSMGAPGDWGAVFGTMPAQPSAPPPPPIVPQAPSPGMPAQPLSSTIRPALGVAPNVPVGDPRLGADALTAPPDEGPRGAVAPSVLSDDEMYARDQQQRETRNIAPRELPIHATAYRRGKGGEFSRLLANATHYQTEQADGTRSAPISPVDQPFNTDGVTVTRIEGKQGAHTIHFTREARDAEGNRTVTKGRVFVRDDRPHVVRFTTTQGETFEVDSDKLTTTRPTTVDGKTVQKTSGETTYIEPQVAARAQAFYSRYSEQPGTTTSVELEKQEGHPNEGKLQIVVQDNATEQPVVPPFVIEGVSTPRVGLHPFELFDKGRGKTTREWSIGGAITDVETEQPRAAPPASRPAVSQPTKAAVPAPAPEPIAPVVPPAPTPSSSQAQEPTPPPAAPSPSASVQNLARLMAADEYDPRRDVDASESAHADVMDAWHAATPEERLAAARLRKDQRIADAVATGGTIVDETTPDGTRVRQFSIGQPPGRVYIGTVYEDGTLVRHEGERYFETRHGDSVGGTLIHDDDILVALPPAAAATSDLDDDAAALAELLEPKTGPRYKADSPYASMPGHEDAAAVIEATKDAQIKRRVAIATLARHLETANPDTAGFREDTASLKALQEKYDGTWEELNLHMEGVDTEALDREVEVAVAAVVKEREKKAKAEKAEREQADKEAEEEKEKAEKKAAKDKERAEKRAADEADRKASREANAPFEYSLEEWKAEQREMGYPPDEIETAIGEATRLGQDPTRSDDLNDLATYLDAYESDADFRGESAPSNPALIAWHVEHYPAAEAPVPAVEEPPAPPSAPPKVRRRQVNAEEDVAAYIYSLDRKAESEGGYWAPDEEYLLLQSAVAALDADPSVLGTITDVQLKDHLKGIDDLREETGKYALDELTSDLEDYDTSADVLNQLERILDREAKRREGQGDLFAAPVEAPTPAPPPASRPAKKGTRREVITLTNGPLVGKVIDKGEGAGESRWYAFIRYGTEQIESYDAHGEDDAENFLDEKWKKAVDEILGGKRATVDPKDFRKLKLYLKAIGYADVKQQKNGRLVVRVQSPKKRFIFRTDGAYRVVPHNKTQANTREFRRLSQDLKNFAESRKDPLPDSQTTDSRIDFAGPPAVGQFRRIHNIPVGSRVEVYGQYNNPSERGEGVVVENQYTTLGGATGSYVTVKLDSGVVVQNGAAEILALPGAATVPASTTKPASQPAVSRPTAAAPTQQQPAESSPNTFAPKSDRLTKDPAVAKQWKGIKQNIGRVEGALRRVSQALTDRKPVEPKDLAAVQKATTIYDDFEQFFDRYDMPQIDDWSRWQHAQDDAKHTLDRLNRTGHFAEPGRPITSQPAVSRPAKGKTDVQAPAQTGEAPVAPQPEGQTEEEVAKAIESARDRLRVHGVAEHNGVTVLLQREKPEGTVGAHPDADFRVRVDRDGTRTLLDGHYTKQGNAINAALAELFGKDWDTLKTAPPVSRPAAPAAVTVRGYHGSAEIARRGAFEGFRLDIAPTGAARKVGETVDAMGTWWTSSRADAEHYARYYDEDGKTLRPGAVVEGDLALTNPRVFDTPDAFMVYVDSFRPRTKGGGRGIPSGQRMRTALEADGHDGFIVKGGGQGDATPEGGDFYLSFENKGVTVGKAHMPAPVSRPAVSQPAAVPQPVGTAGAGSFKVEVTDGSGYTSNAIRYRTREEAQAAGDDLMSRWMAAKDMRVVESDDAPTHTWSATDRNVPIAAEAPAAPAAEAPAAAPELSAMDQARAKLEAERAALKAATEARAKRILEMIGRTGVNTPLDPEIIKEVILQARDYIKLGIVEFKDAALMFREQFGDHPKAERYFELVWPAEQELMSGRAKTFREAAAAVNARKEARPTVAAAVQAAAEREAIVSANTPEAFAAAFTANPQAVIDYYTERFKNVVTADDAKELYTPYAKGTVEERTKIADEIHPISSKIAHAVYTALIAREPGLHQDPVVLFVVGGTGAGKTTARKTPGVAATEQRAVVVFDGSFSNADNAAMRVQMALNAGKGVSIIYVNRDPVEAWKGAQERAGVDGRTIPDDYHIKSHVLGLPIMDHLTAKFAGKPVAFHYFDNAGEEGGVNPVTREDLGGYNVEDVREGIEAARRAAARRPEEGGGEAGAPVPGSADGGVETGGRDEAGAAGTAGEVGDGQTPPGRTDGAGQLSEPDGGGTGPDRTTGAGALGTVLPGAVGEPAGTGAVGPGDSGAGGVVADGVPGAPGDDQVTGDAPPVRGGTAPDGTVAPSGNTGGRPGTAPPDYALTPERIAAIINRGTVQRVRDNLAAIQIVKSLQAEKRYATPEEQDILAKYVGWGHSEVADFLGDYPQDDWSGPANRLWREIQDTTTADERAAMADSTPYAHYTFDLFRPIWNALERFGFMGGRVLEPSVGSGHAFGFMPAEMRAASTLNAVELEPLTAAIAKALYPSAHVQPVGYQDARIARGTQDLIIGNPPFGPFSVSDKAFTGPKAFLTEALHTYFFAKALDHVRPGGYVVFITSRYTMDAPDHTKVRRYLMGKAHFVGAIRLPNVAFKGTAKTEVITDLIILQRFTPDERVARNAQAFITSPKLEALSTEYDSAGKAKNVYRSSWYDEHPEFILGTEDLEGKLYGKGQYNVSATTDNVQAAMTAALEQILPADGYQPATTTGTEPPAPTMVEGEYKPGELRVAPKGDTNVRIQRVQRDGQLVDATPRRVVNPTTRETGVDEKAVARITGMIGIRDRLRDVLATMRDPDASNAAVETKQAALQRAYDKFVKAHGELNSRENKRAFEDDPEATNLQGLEILEPKATEIVDKKKGRILKITYEVTGLADIFTVRTVQAARVVTHVDTPKDALLASLGVKTKIDWPYMASITGQTVPELQAALVAEGRIFEQPDGTWVASDEYLSGDVVSKLDDAEIAAETDARFRPNVDALKAIQPTPKTKDDIASGQVAITLGSHWVPPSDIGLFVNDQLPAARGTKPFRGHLMGAESFVHWAVQFSAEAETAGKSHPLAVPYGPKAGDGSQPYTYGFTDLLKDALNLQLPDLGYWTGRGEDREYHKDPEGTKAARANLEELRTQWMQWVFENEPVQTRLLATFNERFNRTVKRTYDGSHLVNVVDYDPETKQGTRTEALPGLALPFPLFKHQLNGIWRALTTGNTLLAHEVGAGKTFEMIVTAMEMRRTGRARKPMITVPTNLLGQWRRDILTAYPGAKVLAFDEKDLAADKRQKAMARIAFGDWDIVLVPHSSFELLKVSDQRMIDVMQRWVDELMDAERAARKAAPQTGRNRARGNDQDLSVKKLAAVRKKIEGKIQAKLDTINDSDDNALTWEQLGVDALLVDEAHSFKNLYFFSKMDAVKGVSRSEADKSLDMFVKIQEINEQSGYRNLVFGTATPVMNSIAELYTMQRYLQPQALRDMGLENFDNWYQMFASALPTIEQRPDGTHHEVMRVRSFRNLNLLYKTFAEVMDYVGWQDMPYLKLPKLKGGRIQIVETDPHPLYDTIKQWFSDRLEAIRQIPPHVDDQGIYIAPERMHPLTREGMGRPDNILTVINDAKKAAIDMRLLLGSDAKDFEGSRIQTVVRDAMETYKAETDKKGAQLLFLDVGTPATSEPLEFLRGVTVEDATEGAFDDEVAGADAETTTDEDNGAADLYAAVKRELIKRGVPSREIAFIHQAKNAGERLALFTAVNEGRVRFLLASTDKGGVGMNVQKRMAAIHHIDAPRFGRPGDLRQRDGRGIRQGNDYPEITIARYVTRGTTDEWLYGMLNSKSNLITSFMRGDIFNFVDDDPSTKSIEEAQILATGDVRGQELTKLRTEIPRLQAQAAAAERTHAQARAELSQVLSRTRATEAELGHLRAWLPKHETLRGDAFAMNVGGTTHLKRTEAEAALEAALGRLKKTTEYSDKPTQIAVIGGLRVFAKRRTWDPKHDLKDNVTITLDLDPIGQGDQTILFMEVPPDKPPTLAGVNLVAKLVNEYEDIPKREGRLEAQIATNAEVAKTAQEVIDRPNPAKDKAAAAEARIAQIETELKAEGIIKDKETKAALTAGKDGEGERPRYTVRLYNAPAKIVAPKANKTSRANPDIFQIVDRNDARVDVVGQRIGNYFGVYKKGQKQVLIHLPTGSPFGTYDKRPSAIAVGEHVERLGGDGWNQTDWESLRKSLPEDVRREATRLQNNQEAEALAAARPRPKKVGAPSAPSGTASVGEYATGPTAPPSSRPAITLPNQPATTGLGNVLPGGIHPVEFPELVDLARKIQSVPQVVKRFRGAGVRGAFYPGSGMIRIAAELFKPGQERQLAAVLAHEIGHLIDWLPDKTLKRGNLLGRLQSLHNFLKGTYDAADGMTIENAEVRDELKQLSAKWRPWDEKTAPPNFRKYRNSSKELYADAISVLLNDPDMAQRDAPVFYKEFLAELDKKPDVKAAFFGVWEQLSGTREELITRRRAGVQGMFAEANTKAVDLLKLKQAEREMRKKDIAQRMWHLMGELVDKHAPFIQRLRADRKAGVTVAPEDNPFYALSERAYRIAGSAKAFLQTNVQPLLDTLTTNDLSWEQFGEAMMYERIIAGDRSELANPRGLSPAAAQELHDDLMRGLTPKQQQVLRTGIDDYRAAVKDVARQAYEIGLYTDEQWDAIKKNQAYSTFQTIEHMEDPLTSRIHRQIGTVKDIANVADSTTLKTIVTLRAIEHQRAKRVVFEYLHTYHGQDIQNAKETGGKRSSPIPPPAASGLRLVTYFEKGKLKGKYVGQHIAASIENNAPWETTAVVRLMAWANNYFRKAFTTYNPGFQAFNVGRDFLRYWKNMPDMTRRRALKSYWDARHLAAVRAYGLASPESSAVRKAYRVVTGKPATSPTAKETQAYQDLIEAEKAGILGTTFREHLGHDIDEQQIFNILASAGVGNFETKHSPITKPLFAVLNAIADAGDFVESLPKAAGMYEFKGKGTIADIPADQRQYLRASVGSPDFQAGGLLKPFTNNFFLFSNAITQGWRSDLDVATHPTTRAEYLWKTVQTNLLPKALVMAAMMAAAGAGGGDDDDDTNGVVKWAQRQLAKLPWLVNAGKILRKVPEYDLTNYLVIPIGTDDDGNAIVARFPQDDTGRFLGGVFWKMLGAAGGDRHLWRAITDTVSYGAGQVPSTMPAITAGQSAVAYASGGNPYDEFRQKFLFTPDEQKARGWRAFEKFAGWEFQQLGGGVVWKFYPGDERPRQRTPGQVLLDLPVVSNTLGRFVKVTKYGETERNRARGERVESARAERRLDEQEAVNTELRKYWDLPKGQQTIGRQERIAADLAKQLYPGEKDKKKLADNERRLKQRMTLSVKHGEADALAEPVLSATTNDAKVAIIYGARHDYTPAEFSKWLSAAVEQKVISREVRIAVERKIANSRVRVH